MEHDDQREYDPYGERYTVPDHHLDADEKSVGEAGTYPGGQASVTRTCVGCGADLPDIQGRSKCRHCLERGLDAQDGDPSATPGRALEWQFVESEVRPDR